MVIEMKQDKTSGGPTLKIPFYTQEEIGVEDELLVRMENAYHLARTKLDSARECYTFATKARGDRPDNMPKGEDLNIRDHTLWVGIDRLETAVSPLEAAMTELSESRKKVWFRINGTYAIGRDSLCWRCDDTARGRVESNIVGAGDLYEEAASFYVEAQEWLAKQSASVRATARQGLSTRYYGAGPNFSRQRKYVVFFGSIGEQCRRWLFGGSRNDSCDKPLPPYMTLAEAVGAASRLHPILATAPGETLAALDTTNGKLGYIHQPSTDVVDGQAAPDPRVNDSLRRDGMFAGYRRGGGRFA
jgi:hypothetical protein